MHVNLDQIKQQMNLSDEDLDFGDSLIMRGSLSDSESDPRETISNDILASQGKSKSLLKSDDHEYNMEVADITPEPEQKIRRKQTQFVKKGKELPVSEDEEEDSFNFSENEKSEGNVLRQNTKKLDSQDDGDFSAEPEEQLIEAAEKIPYGRKQTGKKKLEQKDEYQLQSVDELKRLELQKTHLKIAESISPGDFLLPSADELIQLDLPLAESDELALTIDNKKVVQTQKSKFEITNWRQRHKVIAPLEVIIHEAPTVHPDSQLEYNIVDQWDDFDPYSCVTCHMPFDSMAGRVPYMLPCRHNACIACVKQSIEFDKTNFDCPIDNCFVSSVEEVKQNKELFVKVKTRQRSNQNVKNQNDKVREQIQRDRLTELNAQMSQQAAIAFEKQQASQAVREREMRDMMNGARQVPQGADRMLQLMKEEQDMEPDHSESDIKQLNAIEAKKVLNQQQYYQGPPQTLKRRNVDEQVEIGGIKLVDQERTNKLFRDEPAEREELSQPTKVRRNHFPPGPVIDEPNKKKVYTNIKSVAIEENKVQETVPKPEGKVLVQSKKVGNKYRLDDSQVRQIINKKYNPENDNIVEQSAENNTYNLSMTQKAMQDQMKSPKISTKHLEQLAQDFDPPRDNSFRQASPEGSETMNQTGLSYTYVMAGGKKKKKKKKKKSKKRNGGGDASQRSMISQESGQSVPMSLAASEQPTDPYKKDSLQFKASEQNFVFPENQAKQQQEQKNSNTELSKTPNLSSNKSTQELRNQPIQKQPEVVSKFGNLQPLQKQQNQSTTILPPILNQLPQNNEETFGMPKPGEKNIVIDTKKPQYFTQEQLTEAFQLFDPEDNGVVSPKSARQALDQVGMFVTQKIHKALKEAEKTSWGGQIQVNYIEIIKQISRDPPGYVRPKKDVAVPKYYVIETGNNQKQNQKQKKDQESDEDWTTGSKSTQQKQSTAGPPNFQTQSTAALRSGSPEKTQQQKSKAGLTTSSPENRPPMPSRSPFLAQAGQQIMVNTSKNQSQFDAIFNQQQVVSGGSEDEGSERNESEKSQSQLKTQSQLVTQTQFQKSMQQSQKKQDVGGKPTEDQYNQWTKLGQFCQQHPKEQIRFYCRDDLEPLCCECVVLHAKHDFISADHKAAIQVKAALTGCLGNIETQLNVYQDLLKESSLKLQEMEHDQRRQLAKISETFKEIREQLFQRELKIKKLIHESIIQSQSTLRSDVASLEQILQELISMKVSGGELRKNMDQERDNVTAIVGSSAHVSKLHKAFKEYHQNILSSHEPGSFVIRNEMANHPAVPEFIYNAAESRQFIDELGQIHQAANFPTNSVGGAAGLKSTTGRLAGENTLNSAKPDSDSKEQNLLQLKTNSALAAPTQHVLMYQQQMPSQDNVYWPKWDSFDLYQYDFFRRKWTIMPDLRAHHKFLYFSSVCHLPKTLGMFIIGGSDVDDNFSKRNTFINRYKVFEDKAPMVFKRAFFPSIFSIQDSSVYVFGGNSGDQDLACCEKYSVADNQWRQISSMTLRRNGSSVVAFQKHIFIFGGNEQDVGSLDSIEKYTIELDKWQICKLRLKEPIHDTISFNLGGNRVLIFGGNSNSQINTTFDVYDLTCETLTNLEPLETGKCYMPPVLDHGSGYLHYYVGYCDQELHHSRLNIGALICTCATRGGQVREVVLRDNNPDDIDKSIGSVRGNMMSRSKRELMDRNKSPVENKRES